MTARAALLLLSLAACQRRTPIATCADDLSGAYTTDTGERWMLLDTGTTLEAYPLFDDTHPPGAPPLEIGPRALDLTRTPAGADGSAKRRFGRASSFCTMAAPAHLLACSADTLELVLADPLAPTSFSPCTPAATPPTHRERWTHE